MLERLEPLKGGRETEIDIIEREMEGGVLVVQSPSIYEHDSGHFAPLVEYEKDIEIRPLIERRTHRRKW